MAWIFLDMGALFLRPCLKPMLPSPLRGILNSSFNARPQIRCQKISATLVSGIERETLYEFISGRTKSTEVAHSVWKSVLRRGDCAVDATCGNGYDTLAMLKLVKDDSGGGFVHGFDIQASAIESTLSLLEESVDEELRKRVKLSHLCHSRMEEVVSKDAEVKLVAFNLGYLPGGDRERITVPETTLPALEAASRVVVSEGLISVVVYVGHPGGMEEYETVQKFASSLPAESWSCCKLERLNRPTAPVLVLLFKK